MLRDKSRRDIPFTELIQQGIQVFEIDACRAERNDGDVFLGLALLFKETALPPLLTLYSTFRNFQNTTVIGLYLNSNSGKVCRR
jgi:hypothetical protein